MLQGDVEHRRSGLRWEVLRTFRFVLAVLALGPVCGLGGAAFTTLLKFVEWQAFHLTTGTVAEAAVQAHTARRFLVVAAAGCLVALAWWALRKWGSHVPSVGESAEGHPSPVVWTIAETALQVVNVGVGASIGREGAPRQFGAMSADACARLLALSSGQRRVLVACGAGAGLASIYNVPVGGAFFAVECVIGVAALKAMRPAGVLVIALAAFASSYLATIVAWIVVPDRPIYPVPRWDPGLSLPVFGLLGGPLFGAVGHGFSAAFEALAHRAPKGGKMLWMMPLCYFGLAGLAVPLPLVLGNGHALALAVFAGGVPLTTAAALILAKPLATFLTVGCGAAGGKLTPSLSTGAVLGAFLATAWITVWPLPISGAAVVGAGAVLAAATDAPMTAVVLMIEFTAADVASWPALTIATLGAFLTGRLLRRGARALAVVSRSMNRPEIG